MLQRLLQNTLKSFPTRRTRLQTGLHATIIHCSPQAEIDEILEQLALPDCDALIVLSGGAGGLAESLKPQLTQVFSQIVARIGAQKNALYIDGGTDSGVMSMLGQGVKAQGAKTPLIGVAPEGLVEYPNRAYDDPIGHHELTPVEPNHSHLVLVNSDEWGSELFTMYGLAAALKAQMPGLTILANGGVLSRAEILQSVRLGLPIIILEGSGRLADDLAALYHRTPKRISNPMLAEIIRKGDLHLCPLDEAQNQMGKQLKKLI